MTHSNMEENPWGDTSDQWDALDAIFEEHYRIDGVPSDAEMAKAFQPLLLEATQPVYRKVGGAVVKAAGLLARSSFERSVLGQFIGGVGYAFRMHNDDPAGRPHYH